VARLLFIENREKTYLWAAVARRLAVEGHDIVWLVQNPLFARELPGRVNLISFPSRGDLDPSLDLAEYPTLSTDRGREHFGAGHAHYAYYAVRIAAILDAERPTLAIGEPTLFHELLALDLCARAGIPYAHPVGERYPPDRFAIFEGASQRPMVMSGDGIDAGVALDLARRIADGREMPIYMVKGGRLDVLRNRLRWAVTRGRVIAGRWLGERYNTPSLRRKLAMRRSIRVNLKHWRAAESLPPAPERTILYPLQMQPENTIDVWGRPDWDQVEIVKRMLAATPADVHIAVKSNPKPYHEMSSALLDLCVGHSRVHLLPLDMGIGAALGLAAGAVTVTGTVGYEAVCGRGRCLSTSHPILDDHFPAFTAPSIESATLRLLEDPAAGRGSPEQGARLMALLAARSFAGIVSDPVSDPRCMAADNIARIAASLSHAIENGEKSY
jgi:hypothetical protein